MLVDSDSKYRNRKKVPAAYIRNAITNQKLGEAYIKKVASGRLIFSLKKIMERRIRRVVSTPIDTVSKDEIFCLIKLCHIHTRQKAINTPTAIRIKSLFLRISI
jgi:hypothetical protein